MKKLSIEFMDKVLDFGDFLKYSDALIETGTCHGRTTQIALDKGYKEVHTVEVHEPFYKICQDRFQNVDNVFLYFGKSTEQLGDMLLNKPCVIFLDAHPTGPNSGGHDDLIEKGDQSEFHQDSILKRELEIILEHRKDHVIIIDDQNGFNDISEAHMRQIVKANSAYKFYFYDEGEGEHFYKNKIIVCIAE